MLSARTRCVPATRWLCAAIVSLFGALGSSGAVADSEFSDDDPPPYVHDHAAWTMSICPVLMSMTDLESGPGTDANSHIGLALTLSRKLSQVTLFDIGVQVTEALHTDDAVPVFQFKFGPKLMVREIQRDRFFVGIGGVFVAADTKGRGSRWGGGPTLSMGLDYAVSHSHCLYLDGTLGIAVLTKKPDQVPVPDPHNPPLPPDGPIHLDWENGAAWGQLALGLRFPL